MARRVHRGRRAKKGDTGPQGPKGDTGPAVALDPTLSIEGKAADAKATGDAIGELNNDLSNKLPKSPTNWEAWTTEEQTAAQERLGILSVEEVLF